MLSVEYRKVLLTGVLALGLVFSVSGCAADDAPAESTDAASVAPNDATTDDVAINTETAAGEESQRIVDLLNAAEDTTADDWQDRLHPSFTAEVSVEELVELFNQNLRPAQPFTVSTYEGGDRQAVTTLTSPLSDPIEMTIALDPEALITGLFFTPTTDG